MKIELLHIEKEYIGGTFERNGQIVAGDKARGGQGNVEKTEGPLNERNE